jgi:hypothetical protein
VHGIPIGTTIMNQTGDVISFATAANPYPCNATMGFNDHNRTSLIHSPDPQVKPGWKEFGWGHGSVWSGIAEPVDALGIHSGPTITEGLRLDLTLPAEAYRGEFVWATVTATNTSDAAISITTALNLAEGDLRIRIDLPNGDEIEARDVVIVCGPRRYVELQPGESVSGQVQLFYTPEGLTFDQPGKYAMKADLSIGDALGSIVYSNTAEIVIRPATDEDERAMEQLTMDRNVGLSLALGDVGTDTGVLDRLTAVYDRFGTTDTGAAAALVVANSVSRDLRDLRSGGVLRPANEALAERAFDTAVQGRDAAAVAELATAVVSPRETGAPVLQRVNTRLRRARKGTYAEADIAQATKLLNDHLA